MEVKKLALKNFGFHTETFIVETNENRLLCPYNDMKHCSLQCAMFEESDPEGHEAGIPAGKTAFYCNYQKSSVFLGLNATEQEPKEPPVPSSK